MGTFATWTAEDLQRFLVAPMLAAQIRAQAIVLDFPLSASLLPVRPRCARAGGIILATLYGTDLRVMNREAWKQMQAALTSRNQPQIVRSRAQKPFGFLLGAVNTGLSNMQKVRAAGWGAVADHIRRYPNDRDPVSILRVLVPMGADIRYEAANLPRLYAVLQPYKQRPLPWEAVGFAEQAILALLPGDVQQMTPGNLSTDT